MKVLVAVASKHGSTEEIAEEVGRVLTDAGVPNDVRSVEDVKAIHDYDAVVLGSATYMGSWMDSATHFVARHGEDLALRPVWLFSSGPIGDPPHPTPDHAVDVGHVMEVTGAREHRLFGGRLDYHSLSFGERAVMLSVHAPEGDRRDWDAIAAWGHGIAEELMR
jgi:menaquinone-dependent protoporphyrinogen oxidase